MKYRADIDGLRAVAILPVLLFHVSIGAFSGGFVGVDIFFVISGYIIARTLRDDLEGNRFSILTFYERRIRRIFPALIAVIFLTWIAALAILLPGDFKDFSKSLTAAAGFTSNLYFWKNSGYFDSGALLRPLLHTWSLSVEEQFYIFMPIAMAVIYRYGGKRWVWWLLPAALLSLALSAYALNVGPTANFFLLPTRAWELLLGTILALSPPPAVTRRWTNEMLAALGIGMIAWAVLAFNETTPFPGPNALLPCVGAALLIYVGGHSQTIIGRALMWRPMVGIGLISYSLYLIHWPIAVFARHLTLRAPTLAESALMIAVSLALAIMLWRYVEQPFRRPKQRAPRKHVLIAGVIVTIVIALIGISGVYMQGYPQRFPDYTETKKEKGKFWRNGKCFFEEYEDSSKWNAKDCVLTRDHGETVMLWGDSFAAHYVPGIETHAKQIPYRLLQYTFAGCPPVLSYYSYARPRCQTFNRRALEIIQQEKVTRVILAARWVDLQLRGIEQLRSTLEAMKAMGVRVDVIGQSPLFATDVRMIAYRKGGDHWPTTIPMDLNTQLEAVSAGAGFINPTAYLCAGGWCAYRKDNVFVYSDNGHLSLTGSAQAVKDYMPVF